MMINAIPSNISNARFNLTFAGHKEPGINGRQLIHYLERRGFQRENGHGDHVRMIRKDQTRPLIVPDTRNDVGWPVTKSAAHAVHQSPRKFAQLVKAST